MIRCIITSPEKTTVYEDVQSITLPASSGQMQILPSHAESFIVLQKGAISLRKLHKSQRRTGFPRGRDRQDKTIHILNGECYIKNNTVTIIL